MSIKLGINPIVWSNDDLPSLGEHISLETCLAQAREAGYQGIEWGSKFPRDPEVLTPLLKSYDLQLISGWVGGRLLQRTVEEELQAHQESLHILKTLGCEVLIYAEVLESVHSSRSMLLSQRPHMPADRWEEYGTKLTAFAEHCAAQGLKLAYHHHMGTVIESEDEIDALMTFTGDLVGLTLDTGHLCFAKADLAGVIEKHGRRVRHVHLKDVRAEVLQRVSQEPCSFLDAVVDGVYTVPGDGCLDFPGTLKALKEVDYQGWLVVEAEQDPRCADPLVYAQMGAKAVRNYLEALEWPL